MRKGENDRCARRQTGKEVKHGTRKHAKARKVVKIDPGMNEWKKQARRGGQVVKRQVSKQLNR